MGNIAKRTGCKMLLAQKAFSNYDCYHLLEPYLTGTEASGLYEARLGAQEMPLLGRAFRIDPKPWHRRLSVIMTAIIFWNHI